MKSSHWLLVFLAVLGCRAPDAADRRAPSVAPQAEVAALTDVVGSAIGLRPVYAWAAEAKLVVAGHVESVEATHGTLRVTKVLAGAIDAATISFDPTTHPNRMTVVGGSPGFHQRLPTDLVAGEDAVVFLGDAKDATWTLLDCGYAKVHLGQDKSGYLHGWPTASLDAVELVVSIARMSDVAARDAAMIRAATAQDPFVRGEACQYVISDLGVALPPDRMRAGGEVVRETHRAAVRRLADAFAPLLAPAATRDVNRAALFALWDAQAAPSAAYADVARLADTWSRGPQDQSLHDAGCAVAVLVLYDRADAVEALLAIATRDAQVLVVLGRSPRPEARAALLGIFGGDADAARVRAAARGLGARLAQTPDPEVEKLLMARFTSHASPPLEETLADALMPRHTLEVASFLLDEMTDPSMSWEFEARRTQVLRAVLAKTLAVPGFRDLLVKRQDVFIKRLAAGKTESEWPLYLLRELGTDEAMAAVRRAAKSHPDRGMRQHAAGLSEPLSK